MFILFETYYNETLAFARKLYLELIKFEAFDPNENGIDVIISDEPQLSVRFLKESRDDSYASFQAITNERRTTITTKTGKKARRILIVGGIINIYVANVLKHDRRSYGSKYKTIEPYITEHKDGAYNLSKYFPPDVFLAIVKMMTKTTFFQQIFAHEVQHFYNRWIHKRAETHRKVKTKEPLSRKDQRELNYFRSNAEIDSRTVEVAASVMNQPALQHLFDENTPENLREFIDACKAVFIHSGVWYNFFTESIKRRIIRRLSQIYYNEVENY